MRLEEKELKLKQFIRHIGRIIWWSCPIKEDGIWQCIRIDSCVYRGEPTFYTSKGEVKRWECNLYRFRDNGKETEYDKSKNEIFQIIDNN